MASVAAVMSAAGNLAHRLVARCKQPFGRNPHLAEALELPAHLDCHLV
ncbi:hypothetical protein ABID21_000055 [Pseudorhizobium tarimense]|uniref:Uncharacterized protein n=1 Tax=Pseudorhizobium tarimense TaxID=1079109 RepID=A0ABV2H0A3_9HYPH|nr:hypothetical protein [Pseudorhizobium tarimense]MCJ8517312.1 hypothetical protein [Pseudorhizobium tarimense]